MSDVMKKRLEIVNGKLDELYGTLLCEHGILDGEAKPAPTPGLDDQLDQISDGFGRKLIDVVECMKYLSKVTEHLMEVRAKPEVVENPDGDLLPTAYDEATDPFTRELISWLNSWLNGLNDEPENAFQVQRYGMAEAKRLAHEAATDVEAGEALKHWFTDRLTVDPGVPGPFGGLFFNLLNTILEQVDWAGVAYAIRAK